MTPPLLRRPLLTAFCSRNRFPTTFAKSFPRRSIVTLEVEPPLDSDIPEKPCTVVLVEDPDLYSQDPWRDDLARIIPNQFGMTFGAMTLPSLETNDLLLNQKNKSNKEWIEASLEDFQRDLGQFQCPQIVLIARGPIVSWLAQLHLESFHLAGKILVDPLPLRADTAKSKQVLTQATDFLKSKPGIPNDSPSVGIQLLESCIQHPESVRPLLVEAGVIPIMVGVSHAHVSFRDGAQGTSERHSEDDESCMPAFVGPPIVTLTGKSIDKIFQEDMGPWIEKNVL